MMLSDLAAGSMTVIILILFSNGNLQIWHLYLTGAFAGAFEAFQFPAYSAAITMMLPKEQFGRASGMLSLAQSGSQVLAPLLAGVLLAVIGIGGVLSIDILTFVIAVITLLAVFIPQPEASRVGAASQGNLWEESIFGFRYILQRPSLLGLQTILFAINLIATFSFVLITPLILQRTGSNKLLLGSVLSIMGLGGVVGGLLMSAWGGPKRKVDGVLGGIILSGLTGPTLIGLGRALPVWGLGAFADSFFIPILNGSNQAIWQSKVEPDVQGRVFSVRRLIAQISAPVALLLAGPMADRVFEPAMAVGGPLSGVVGWLVGVGNGAGIGLMFLISGVLWAAVGVVGYLIPAIRNVEEILPDYQETDQVETGMAAAPAGAQ
jgi:MFS family permease